MEWLPIIISGMLGFAGIIFGFISTFKAASIAKQVGIQETYSETVAKVRVEWLRVLNERIGIVLSCARMIQFDKENRNDLLKNYFCAKYMLLAQLNLHHIDSYGEYSRALFKNLTEMENAVLNGVVNGEKSITVFCDEITKLIINVEAHVWLQVKIEASEAVNKVKKEENKMKEEVEKLTEELKKVIIEIDRTAGEVEVKYKK